MTIKEFYEESKKLGCENAKLAIELSTDPRFKDTVSVIYDPRRTRLVTYVKEIE